MPTTLTRPATVRDDATRQFPIGGGALAAFGTPIPRPALAALRLASR